MLKKLLAPAFVSTLLIVTACSSHHKDKVEAEVTEASPSTQVTQENLDKITESWPQASKDAIKSLTGKYGLPAALTNEMVVWNNTSPFKRSVVYKEEVTHQFPMQHSDVLMQTIDYRVPQDKVAELSKDRKSVV